MNEDRTRGPRGTNLTQADSLDVHAVRKSLDALRAKHGADTPTGHRCSNLIEQLKNYQATNHYQVKWELERLIRESMTELAKLSSGPEHHAEERHETR